MHYSLTSLQAATYRCLMAITAQMPKTMIAETPRTKKRLRRTLMSASRGVCPSKLSMAGRFFMMSFFTLLVSSSIVHNTYTPVLTFNGDLQLPI